MTFLYVDKHGRVPVRYVRILRFGRFELAVAWILGSARLPVKEGDDRP